LGGAGIEAGVGYKSATPLAKAITVLMGFEIVLALCNDLNSFVTIGVMKRVLAGEVVAPAESTAIALRTGAISALAMVLSVVVTVLFCLFMPRANRNARAFGSSMTISPGWAAGWFFVPVANFWMPYQAMKEIWQGSDPDPNARPGFFEAPGLIKWWWLTYLLRGFAGPAVYFASRDENRTQAAIDLSTVTIATSVLTLISAPLAAATVRAVARRQDERQKRHPAGTTPPVPAATAPTTGAAP
jgi:heme/copper-type cytochrome/quinol oxidase subunit 2